jgi:Tfp pilus assembly protein PilE
MHRMSVSKKHVGSSGFTLIEMLVVAPVAILAIGGFIALMVSMVGSVMITRDRNTLTYEVQDALDRIEQDTRLATQFHTTTNSLPSPQGSNDSTAAFTNSSSLILSSFATDKNPRDISRQLIYYANQPNPCGATQNLNRVFLTRTVYFIKNGSLWRRGIVPTYNNNATADANTVCGTSWQRNSCTLGYTVSPPCETNDEEIMKNIDTFDVTYYSSLGNTTPLSDSNANDASTIEVSIVAKKTAAGESIHASGTMIATKVNGASSEKPPIATPPLTNATSPTELNTVTFSWDKSPTATSYLISYAINGGSWVNTTVNENTDSYQVSVTRGDSVTFRVAAKNATETSPYATTTTTVPIWATFDLQSNWEDYNNSYATHAFTRTKDGVVMLKGLIRLGTSGFIGTLPVGYRPSERLIFGTSTNPDQSSRVDILPNGEIHAIAMDAGWLSLDGINFMSSGTSWTNLPLYNNWTNWLDTYAPIQSSPRDPSGRIHVQGLGRQGTFADGTVIAQLPGGSAPSEYYHTPGRGSVYDLIGIASTGAIHAKGADSHYKSIQLMYYASGYGSWSNLALMNNWVFYGVGYTTPQFTKAADGIVTIKGLIKGGTTSNGIQLATLPVGYRPAERLLLTSPCYGTFCRIDILPTGAVHLMTGNANRGLWTSLDGLTFRAEQ